MPESTSPTPMPASGGESNPTPDLTVLSGPSPRQVGLTKRQMEALSLTIAIIDVARRPEYAPHLKGINAAFLTALEEDVAKAFQFGRAVVGANASGKDATLAQSTAEQDLVSALQSLQAAARIQHLPNHPALLEKYYIGKELTASRAILETLSQNIIAQANAERPGETDTNVIVQATQLREAYLSPESQQQDEAGRRTQACGDRDELLKSIVARRKKIQYSADAAWPSKKVSSRKARSDFKLPANRPYSY